MKLKLESGQAGSSGAKRGQARPSGAKRGQEGPSGAKQCQKWPNGAEFLHACNYQSNMQSTMLSIIKCPSCENGFKKQKDINFGRASPFMFSVLASAVHIQKLERYRED